MNLFKLQENITLDSITTKGFITKTHKEYYLNILVNQSDEFITYYEIHNNSIDINSKDKIHKQDIIKDIKNKKEIPITYEEYMMDIIQ